MINRPVRSTSCYLYKVDLQWGSHVQVDISPTADCQTFSINPIQVLFSNEPRENWQEVIVALMRTANKKQMLFNIEKSYEESVNALIEDLNIRVVFRNEYTSTRNSEMIFYLVDLTPLWEKYGG